MTLSNGWLDRQIEKATKESQSFPQYLKKESGLSVSRRITEQTPVASSSSRRNRTKK
jgi:hypothetical protein